MHYFELKLISHYTFSGSNLFYSRDNSRFIFGNIYDWNVFVIFLSPCFFKSKGDIVIASIRLSIRPSVRPSVCPLWYHLLNGWTKFNQIRCVSYSHEWGMQRQKQFWPRPLGPWGGIKRSNIIKFQLQTQFQKFSYQTLCLFSQMKDTKHIRRDIYSVAWIMPQGSDFGALGVPRGYFFFKHGHVAYQIDGDDMQNRMQVKFSSLG